MGPKATASPSWKTLESTLRTAFASPNTAIIDVIVERDENVYPTVPSGASLDEMLLL